ncbi:radical SAM protein [bacterium]|nr:radical SAM protein [bacterium]
MAYFTREKFLKSEISLLPAHSKKWAVRAAAVFPNDYRTGMSNLGFLEIFEIMHRFPQLFPQRFFGSEPLSLETGEPLTFFPIIAVSLSFELDFLNLLSLLRKSGISVKSTERKDRILIIGGAAAMINPYPLASIADAIFIGDNISNIEKIFKILAENPPGIVDKQDLLAELSKIEGVWIPSLLENPPQRAISVNKIQNAEATPFEEVTPPSSAIVSSFAAFPNMILVQIQQGCPFRCPFCATPVIYNPFQNFSVESIILSISRWGSRISRIGLVGSAIADYPDLNELLKYFRDIGQNVFTSSLRLDRLNSDIIENLKLSKQRTLTIAPEVGSQKFKKIIGKNFSIDKIISIIQKLPAKEIKLYYIIGLPDEELSDVSAIGDEIVKIAGEFPNRKIIASVNPFVPKRGTKWEYFNMMVHKELIKRFNIVKKMIDNRSNIYMQINYRRKTRLQWVLATGDRQVGEIFAESDTISDAVSKLDSRSHVFSIP